MSQNSRKSIVPQKQEKMQLLNKSRMSVTPKSLIRPSMGNFSRPQGDLNLSDEKIIGENTNLKDILYSKETQIKRLEDNLRDSQKTHNSALLQIQKDSNKKVEKLESKLHHELEKKEKYAQTLEYMGIDPNTTSAIELSKKDAQILKDLTDKYDNKAKSIQNNIRERKQQIQQQMSVLSSMLDGI
jgi:hypothetical protein